MLETSARLLRLLSLLQTPRDWPGAELAARLDVTTRTVRNDIERLRTLGYPVQSTPGVAGGYRLQAGAAMPPLLLDDEEAVAVAIGLRTAAGGGVAGIEETSLRALAKLEQVLPSRLRRHVNALHTATVQTPDTTGPGVDASVLTWISAACRDRECLRFDYRAHTGGRSRREAEPHRLVVRGRLWYLVAFDIARADWRTFRVDRIEPRTPNGPRFAPRTPPQDAADLVMRGVSNASWRYRAAVTVHAPADEIAARISPFAGVAEPLDDHTCLLRTGADRVETLATHLGLLGAPFTVSGPPELVAHLRELAARYRHAVGDAEDQGRGRSGAGGGPQHAGDLRVLGDR